MNKPQIFTHYEFGEIHVVQINGKEMFAAIQSATALGYSNPHDAVKKHCREDGVAFCEVIDALGRKQQMKFIDEGNLYRLIVRSKLPTAEKFERWVFDEVLPSIRKTGAYIAPTSLEDLIIMQAQSVKELKAKVAQIEERAVAAHHRIDNLDNVNVIGDPQQRLNAMVRKYARDRGLTFTQAWREFRQAYNTAYHTNLTMLVENYKLKHGLRQMTMPEYLMRTGKIEDAIRVADKMLNNQMLGGDYQCLN
jgi:prophage antirepressor-like protein